MFLRAGSAIAGLVATHASFFYMGKRDVKRDVKGKEVDIKEKKQECIDDTKDLLTLSLIPTAIASAGGVAVTGNIKGSIAGPLTMFPFISHGIAYQAGKNMALGEHQTSMAPSISIGKSKP